MSEVTLADERLNRLEILLKNIARLRDVERLPADFFPIAALPDVEYVCSALREARALLRELVGQAEAGTDVYDGLQRDCLYCDFSGAPADPIRHDPDCPIARARALLGDDDD